MERARSNRSAIEQHWRKKPLAERLGTTPSTIDRWRRSGLFPPGKRVSPQVVIWSESEVLEWLRDKEE